MSVPVQEREAPATAPPSGLPGELPPTPLLAGEEEDGVEPHILRGID